MGYRHPSHTWSYLYRGYKCTDSFKWIIYYILNFPIYIVSLCQSDEHAPEPKVSTSPLPDLPLKEVTSLKHGKYCYVSLQWIIKVSGTLNQAIIQNIHISTQEEPTLKLVVSSTSHVIFNYLFSTTLKEDPTGLPA